MCDKRMNKMDKMNIICPLNFLKIGSKTSHIYTITDFGDIYRGSCMSAYVLLNLLNKLGKK